MHFDSGGNIPVNNVTATTGPIELVPTAQITALVGGNNATANNVKLTAGTGIGIGANVFGTNAATVDAISGTGDIRITDASAVTFIRAETGAAGTPGDGNI